MGTIAGKKGRGAKRGPGPDERRPRLVGRERELAAISAAVENPAAAPIFELVGEPGIGKTALLDELCALGDERDYLVFTGRATELEGEAPFAPFVDALDQYLAAGAGARLARLAREDVAELARIFPSLRSEAEPGPAPESERYRAHRAVEALLEELGRSSPLLLAIDDAHWADAASQELLGYLLRRPPGGPVVMAVAYRNGQAPELLQRAVAAAARAGLLRRLAPTPLTRDEADALIGGERPYPVREALYRESGGNPLYLAELLRFGLESGASAGEGIGAEVPPRVAAALAEEVASLSPDARTLAQGAAIAGEPFEPWLAASAAGLRETVALERLDELAAAALVSETETPARLRFRHPLVRRAVYESAPPGWRIAAHQRVAAALERSGAPPLARAHHLDSAAQPGDAEAIATLSEAGRAAASRAPAAAARWYGAALRLLPAEDDRRLELLIARANALGGSGSLVASRQALLEALSLLPPEAGADRVRLVALLAAVETLLGRHTDAGRRLHGELESLADRRSPEAGALQVELAIREVYAGRFDAVPEHAAPARAIAAENGDAVGEAEGAALLAFGELGRGHPDAAARRLDEAAALVDAAEDDALARRLGALHYLGHAEQPGERWADSFRHFERGVELCRATGQGQLLASMLTGQAWAALFLGRLDRAQELGEAAIDSARLGANPLVLVWALLTPTLVGVARGDLTSALAAAEESAELAGRIDVGVFSAQQGWVHAWALLEAGDADRCVEVIEGAGLTDPDHLLVVPGAMCITCELLARAHVERGRPADARLWGERGIAFSEQSQPGADAAFGLGARAVGLLEAGQGREAAELARRAAAGARDVGAPLIEARSRTLAGRALVAAGEPAAAIAELERAHGALRERGAVRWADEAARELRKLGRRVARTTHPGADGVVGLPDLSPREREVAELVAEGRTNRQVAATLYLSEKTVEGNLRRVFAKLGISRRGQLGSLLHREGNR